MSKKNKKDNNVIQFRSVMEQRWEDLDPLHIAAVSALQTIALEIQNSIIVLLSHKITHNDPEVQLLNNSFLKDLDDLTTKLLAINEQHKDKKGLIRTENDLADYLGIGQAYSVFANMVTGVLFNTAAEVENKILELKDILTKQQSETQEPIKEETRQEEQIINQEEVK